MLTIKASVVFKKTEDGGLRRNAISGMQPSFSVDDDLVMCRVESSDGTREFLLGQRYLVNIELSYGELYRESIKTGYTFHLNIGGKIIAEGIVTELLQ